MKYTNLEIGGSAGTRELFKEYTQNVSGLVFVVDGSAEDRLGESREYLDSILAEPVLNELPLLVLVNKSDLGQTVARRAMAELGLAEITNTREVSLLSTNALTGVGVNPAFDWMSKQLLLRKKA